MRPRVIVHAPRADAGPGARQVEVHGETHSLVPLRDRESGTLYWQQPHAFRGEWSLVSERGEHLVLHGLRFARRKLAAETPAATWVLTRSWVGQVMLADAEGRELARIPRGWLGRWRLELPDGPTLVWRRHWRGDRTLEDQEGHEWLRLQRRFGLFRFEAVVTLSEPLRRRSDLLELLAVTFYAWLSAPRGHVH
jgi:hypothetical protein